MYFMLVQVTWIILCLAHFKLQFKIVFLSTPFEQHLNNTKHFHQHMISEKFWRCFEMSVLQDQNSNTASPVDVNFSSEATRRRLAARSSTANACDTTALTVYPRALRRRRCEGPTRTGRTFDLAGDRGALTGVGNHPPSRVTSRCKHDGVTPRGHSPHKCMNKSLKIWSPICQLCRHWWYSKLSEWLCDNLRCHQ